MRNCFNWLEDFSNCSASVLQTNFAKNTSSIAGRGVKSQILYVSLQSCLLNSINYGDHYIPCFLIVPLYICLRWCPNAIIIFLYIYPYIFPLLNIQSKILHSRNFSRTVNFAIFVDFTANLKINPRKYYYSIQMQRWSSRSSKFNSRNLSLSSNLENF